MYSQINWDGLRVPEGLSFPWQRWTQVESLKPGEVHVWLILIDQPAVVIDEMRRLLNPEEQRQAMSYRFAFLQRGFAITHGFLRIILAQYLQMNPAQIVFQNGKYGKPSIKNQAGKPSIQFNLSHSGTFALVAIRLDDPIGIDIESIRPMEDMNSIARQFFALEEVQALESLPAEERLSGFYACWTRKEAFIKATGLGLAQPLKGFIVSLKPDEPARLVDIEGFRETVFQWGLVDLPLPEGYRGALASPCRFDKVKYFFIQYL